jgi:flagellar biosynthesis protein FlhB
MILFILVLLVIFVIFLGVRNKEEIKKGGEDVIKNVYIYLVLFATLMMTIGGTVAAFMAIADVVAPTPYYQTFEEFKLNNGDMKPEIDKNALGAVKLSDAELKAKYDAMVSGEKNRQIERAKNSLIKSLGWIVIPLPVFLYFQRRLVKPGEGSAA